MTAKSCTCLRDCVTPVPQDFFMRICNSASYVNCFHFARKSNQIHPPMAWLQKLAVQKSKMLGMENASMELSDFMGGRNGDQ